MDINAYLNKIMKAMNNYGKLKDELFDKEVFEVISDSFGLINFVKNANIYLSNKRMIAFFKGLSNSNELSENQINRLCNYIQSEKKAEIIAESLSKVFHSNSKMACFMMGFMHNKIINKNDIFSHEELLAYKTLSEMFDDDVKNFILITNFTEEENNWLLDTYSLYEYCESNDIRKSSMHYTLEMLQKRGLVDLEVSYDLDYSETKISNFKESYHDIQTIENLPQLQITEYYFFNDISKVLIDILSAVDLNVFSEKMWR